MELLFDQTLLNEALAPVGYRQRKELIYQAEWSTLEVEHFIAFSRYAMAQSLLTGDFGMRNPCAEVFSVHCIRAYGGDLFKIFRPHGIDYDCTMSFSFGRLTSKVQRWSLDILVLSGTALVNSVQTYVRDRLLPVVGGVTTLDKLLAVLMVDAEPYPWIASNGAIRAAQIVAIGRQIGYEADYICASLEPYKRHILSGLGKKSAEQDDVNIYLERVVADWEIFSRRPKGAHTN